MMPKLEMSLFRRAWEAAFLHHRAWTNPELQAAGITGQRGVYLRVVDGTTRGWGTVSVDNIVVQNAGLPAIPEIISFTASSQSIMAGTPVTLSWTIVDPLGGIPSTAVTPDVGDVTGQSSVVVNPLVTTTYTLIATNAEGTATATTFRNRRRDSYHHRVSCHQR